MDEHFSMYHLHHRREDLMRERAQDRLAALAAHGKPGLLQGWLRRWFASSSQVVNHLVETEIPALRPDVNLVNGSDKFSP